METDTKESDNFEMVLAVHKSWVPTSEGMADEGGVENCRPMLMKFKWRDIACHGTVVDPVDSGGGDRQPTRFQTLLDMNVDLGHDCPPYYCQSPAESPPVGTKCFGTFFINVEMFRKKEPPGGDSGE